jgi:predicted CoA-substrate-specific enzyme activase
VRTAGIDIGSRTVKLAILEDGKLAVSRVWENSFEPLTVCRNILAGERYDSIVATGYGRHLFADRIGGGVITEIKAAALGARRLFPDCRTVLDIGGQDTKAISLAADGAVGRFEMNDKCAAGTGRFLEVMSMALGCTLDEFASLAEESVDADCDDRRVISSTCAVFAESEVVGLIARGLSRGAIAGSIVDAVAGRAASLVRRVGITEPVLFVGGVARSAALRRALAKRLACPVVVPEDVQTVVALGCAFEAQRFIDGFLDPSGKPRALDRS